jgi:putative oxidoreductase
MKFLEQLKPLGLLFLRCALGAIFMIHGYPKLFGQNTAMHQSFAQHGLPRSFLFVAGVLELFGGGLLIIGLFSRAAALLLTVDLAVVMLKMGLPESYANPGFQFEVLLAVATFALATTGPGAISIDQPLFGSKK